MKTKVSAFTIVLAAVMLLLIVAATCTVFVPENKYIAIKRFDAVQITHTEPGLKFKIPFIDVAVELPKNALMYDLKPSEVLTIDKKTMAVSSYVVWKIEDPLLFLKTVVTTNDAENRLDAIVFNAVKNTIGTMDQTEVVSSRGKELDLAITEAVRKPMEEYGVRVIDVQLKQFDLPQDNKEAVYNRMISEREQIAAKYIAEGKEQAEIIKNEADKNASVTLSEARATAEQYKAEGESEYMKILSEAFAGAERAEFYEFIRAMDALKLSMNGDKTLVLPLDSPLTKWFTTQ